MGGIERRPTSGAPSEGDHVATTDPRASSAASPAAPQGKRAFAALRHKPYRIYLGASWLAMAGDNMEHVITYFAMYQAFHNPALAGYAVISHWMPVLLFGFYAGALADRFDCRRLIQTSTAMNVLAQLGWGTLLVTHQLEQWHAVIFLTMHGIAALFHGPATQLIMHDMVGREDLQSAVRLSATSRQFGILLGPGIGGALMLIVGPGVALFFNVLTQIPLALWLVFAPYTGHLRDEGRQRRSLALSDVVKTVRELARNPAILAMLGVVGLTASLVGNAFQAQMPEFAEDLGDPDGGHGYTALQMAQAGGALFGGFALEATGLLRPNVRAGVICAFLFALSVVAFSAAPTIEIAVILLFMTGLLRLAFSTMAQTIVQLEAPQSIRGRALGLFSTAQMGLQVGAGFTIGVVGAVIGVHWSLGLSGALLALGTLVLLVWVTRRGVSAARLATT
jgi:MFS family permease